MSCKKIEQVEERVGKTVTNNGFRFQDNNNKSSLHNELRRIKKTRPFIEDPASDASGVSSPGRVLQHSGAWNTVSLTGFTYKKHKSKKLINLV